MLIISPQLLGRGWAQLPSGQVLRTGDQFFDTRTYEWRIGHFFTSDGQINSGRVPYRRAMSLRAKVEALGPLVRKVWNRRVLTLFS